MTHHQRVVKLFLAMAALAAAFAVWAFFSGGVVAVAAALSLLLSGLAFTAVARNILESAQQRLRTRPAPLQPTPKPVETLKVARSVEKAVVPSPLSDISPSGGPGVSTTRVLKRVSHELRAPLTPVLVKLSSLQENKETPLWLRAELDAMRRGVELEARLIDGLLDLDRLTQPKVRLRPEVTSVHELIERAIELAVQDHDTVPPHIERHFAATQPLVAVDPARFQQVCWNIIKNAIQHTPETGTLTIRTADADERVEITFSDDGEGIEPDFLPHVFEDFSRGQQPGTRRRAGLGLGLCIAKTITEQFGGTLEAESQGQGKGALFTLRLPLPSSTPASPSQPATSSAESSVSRVLFVEDDRDTSEALSAVLSGLGYEVTAAATVAEAITAGKTQAFDLLISDIGLPDGSGLEVQKWFRDNCPIPCIALSGYGSPEDLERSRAVGFMLHIVKPISLATLRWAIAEVTADSTAGEAVAPAAS